MVFTARINYVLLIINVVFVFVVAAAVGPIGIAAAASIAWGRIVVVVIVVTLFQPVSITICDKGEVCTRSTGRRRRFQRGVRSNCHGR